MLKIYVYARCSTCRKALDWLTERGWEFQAIPIRETPPTVRELRRILAKNGGSIRRLFNTSGVEYRQLDMKTKLPEMSETAATELLSKNGYLVKRPVVIGDEVAEAGFSEEKWRAAGL